MSHVKDEEIRHAVRRNLAKQLGSSGLLEYHCPAPACDTQVFTTWEVNLTCNRCDQKVQALYHLDKPWLK